MSIGQTIYSPPVEIAYLAGFFDGEGCISVVRGGPTIAVAVVQVDRRPLDALAEHYGGRVAPHGKPKPGHRQAYRWQIYSANARVFLRDILPFLVVKRESAEMVLAMTDS